MIIENTEDKQNIKNKRELNIDIMKTILVCGMILSHIIDFFCKRSFYVDILTGYFNLISFSGFMFVFGYNSYNAYIIKEKSDVNEKLIRNIFRINFAFYISGISYDLFVLKNLNWKNYINILIFLRLPGYSEFLVTFSLVNLMILIYKEKLKKISENNKYLGICIIISILYSLLPAINIQIPWINLIVKTNSIAFPILPYLNLFFIGIYFAKNKPKFNIKIFSILFCLFYIYLKMCFRNLVTRFPISIAFIIGSYVFIYLYYYLSKHLSYKIENNPQKDIIIPRKKKFGFFSD